MSKGIPLNMYLGGIDTITGLRPRYDTGGIGADGRCDCVGLLMGAMYRAGHEKYPMHSSNYWARMEMERLYPITGLKDLFVGMTVFKRRSAGHSNYQLADRYQAGGRYDTGDRYDYHHVGTVRSISPLIIRHCTKYTFGGVAYDGIVDDSKLGDWCCGGPQKDVAYEGADSDEIVIEVEVPKMAGLTKKNCKVIGGELNLRVSKSTKATRICVIPEGTTVYCKSDEGTWSEIRYEGMDGRSGGYNIYEGYVMTQYLVEINVDAGIEDAPQGDEVSITLVLPRAAAQTIATAFNKSL